MLVTKGSLVILVTMAVKVNRKGITLTWISILHITLLVRGGFARKWGSLELLVYHGIARGFFDLASEKKNERKR